MVTSRPKSDLALLAQAFQAKNQQSLLSNERKEEQDESPQ
jgi:hypothetical protein